MRLTYLGQSFQLNNIPTRTASRTGTLPRTLHYLGNTYQYQMAEPEETRSPRTVNWRYEVR
jgi:hypothetical protein